MVLRSALLNLDSRRATILFLLCFLAGAFCIAFDFLVPWTPAFIVLLYGSVLFYTANTYLITHSEFTNNSPYFLGFLLFLVSLLVAFWRYDQKQDESVIIRMLGAALLTTVIGLPFRQLLFAYSPGQKEEDTFFSTLENELRQNAVQFKKSQQELVTLVAEFIDTRKQIFAEEEQASNLYVAQLLKSAKIFQEAADSYPKVVASAVNDLDKSLTRVKAKLNQLAENAEHVDSLTFSAATEYVKELGGASAHGAASVKDLGAALTSVNGLVGNFSRDVSGVLEQLTRTVSDTVTRLTSTLSGSTTSFNQGILDAESDLRGKIGLIKTDVEAVDDILSQVIKLLERRLVAVQETVK